MIFAVARLEESGARRSRDAGDALVRHRERPPLHAPLAADARADRPQRELRALRERGAGRFFRSLPATSSARCRRLRAAVGELRHRRRRRRAVDPALLHRTSLNTVVTSFVLVWIVGALLIASAGYHGRRAARGLVHRRRLDGRLFEPVRGHADFCTGLGSGARGGDEPHRRAGEHGASAARCGARSPRSRARASRWPPRQARCWCCSA